MLMFMKCKCKYASLTPGVLQKGWGRAALPPPLSGEMEEGGREEGGGARCVAEERSGEGRGAVTRCRARRREGEGIDAWERREGGDADAARG